ncbi:hypothetical protein HPNQ4044_0162 [Helicobacter pylori NQ4044]|uniref:Uncharacterized protein n=1 Tax=Helicobacter pylori NQ4044 TaxID=992028 RepID=J0JKS5_HELPX|nr:hypothetical protein HPNQ4044_0162 [Helicobacter pylori NQ4044]
MGRKFRAFRVFGLMGGYLKKAVLSLLSYHVKISFKLALGVGD